MKRFVLLAILALFIAGVISFYQNFFGVFKSPLKNDSLINSGDVTGKPERISVVATSLEVPWEMVFFPNGDILFTERTGSLKILSNNQVTIVEKIAEAKSFGEGGLLGLALHPNFESNNYIYLYYTYEGVNGQTKNRVVRYKYQNNRLSDRKTIIEGIPGAINHNGGRLKFGPDSYYLYVTTGDSLEPSLAQDKNSLAGKILRVTDEGKPAPGNPFGTSAGKPSGDSRIYSYGHRNPQGLAWDDQGRLWETEHGPSAQDEINIIMRGKNYGWPVITGDQTRDGMESPFAESGQETWAPAGAIFVNNSLFFGGLRGSALFSLEVKNNNAVLSKHFLEEFGRIRNVTKGPDDLIYFSTSNRDGRGFVRNSDDQIIKIDPSQL